MIQQSARRYLLPPRAYTSPEWFEDETASLLGRQWALVASVDELSDPGSYATTTVGHAPLLVVRGDDGLLRAFHNLCRHRGMVMLRGCGHVSEAGRLPGRVNEPAEGDRTGATATATPDPAATPRSDRAAQSIRCFYHQWRYALDGSLVVVPQRAEQFPDLDLNRWGLLPASVAEWEGMVFVHPDPQAPALAETLDELPRYLGSHRPGLLREVVHLRLPARCNWKLFVENHIDVYHLWYLHDRSLGDFDHRRFEHQQVGRNWVSYEPLRPARQLGAAALTQGTVAISHLDERDRIGLGAHLVFPNLMMASAAEFFATYVAEPRGPAETIIDLRIRAEEGADADLLAEALRSFIAEDIVACEAVQDAISSPAFAVGPLARQHEAPITAFHRHILDTLGEAHEGRDSHERFNDEHRDGEA